MINLFLYLIFNFLILKYNIHIFQLNYYMFDTHLKYIFNNRNKFIFLFLLSLFIILFSSKVLTLLIILVLIYLSIEKNVIKKIVYTSRVKRLYITNYLILLLIYFVFNENYLKIYLALTSLSFIYMFILDILNKPINKLINNYYVNDAKNKIKNHKDLIVIGVTGSYGKTSTKNYIYELLKHKYNTLITPGNFNTLLGITRTIREKLLPTHEVFIVEIGIDRVGQMDNIVKLVNFDYVLLTSIGDQHLETFKSVNNIKESKLTILKGLKETGTAFLNYDNEILKKEKLDYNIIGYGTKKDNDIFLEKVNYSEKGMNFTLNIKNEKHEFFSQLLGSHNLINLIASINVALKLGVDLTKIKYYVKNIKPVKHRLSINKNQNIVILDDSYNSNIVGAKSAIDVLSTFDGKKFLITPGMVELGDKEDELNYELGKYASKKADIIVLINKEQTAYFYKGLIDNKFPETNIKVYASFNEGFKYIENDKSNKTKYVLIENDLPDNYKKGVK